MERKGEEKKVAILIGLVIAFHLLSFLSARKAPPSELERGRVVPLRDVPAMASRSDLKVVLIGVDGITWDVILHMVNLNRYRHEEV